MKYLILTRKIFLLLDAEEGNTTWDKAMNTFIVSLILLNTLAVILETVQSIYAANKVLFESFESFSIIIFSIEYVLRLWTYNEKHKRFFDFLFSPSSLIDLLAILPFYLPLVLAFDLRVIRLLRLFRMMRLFKLGRYTKASATIRRVFLSKKEELILSLFITFFLIIIASCLMYFTENEAQPDKFSSIPETMWWSVATLTTVGYGDVYPITALGKSLAACIAILGIGMFALPAGILASGFSEEFKQLKQKPVCPHCGHNLNH